MTFTMFNHVATSIGSPQRPCPNVDLTKVKMADFKAENFKEFREFLCGT